MLALARPFLVMRGAMALFLLLCSVELTLVIGVCPNCHNNIAACTNDGSGTCIMLSNIADNIEALTSGDPSKFGLVGVVSNSLSRVFSRAALEHILSLSKKKQPGTSFTFTESTPFHEVSQAIDRGEITCDEARSTLTRMVDKVRQPLRDGTRVLDDLEKARVESLQGDIKTLLAMKTAINGGKGSSSELGAEASVYTYMWAVIVLFVAGKQMDIRLTADSGEDSSGRGFKGISVNFKRPQTSAVFFESLNLMILFVGQLGLAPYGIFLQFVEQAVYGVMRLTAAPWQVAHETFYILLRHVEDSAGTSLVLSFVNVYDKMHGQHLTDQVQVCVDTHYPDLVFFRPLPGKGGNGKHLVGDEAPEVGKGKKWNNKFTEEINGKPTKPCSAYNEDRPHTAKELFKDGTCKRNHVCFHWIKGHGAGAQCGRKHMCKDCDHPDKCKEKEQ